MGSYLIDSNVVIDYLNRKLPLEGIRFVTQQVNKGVSISAISRIELLSLRVPTIDDSIIQLFVANTSVRSISDEIVDRAIAIRKLKNIKVPDAIIAATALVHESTILTRNVRDFNGVAGLATLNPWTIR